jgi:hypothetical protein
VDDVADDLLIADTDLIIGFLRGRGAGAGLVESSLRSGALRMTAVTAFDCGWVPTPSDDGERSQR